MYKVNHNGRSYNCHCCIRPQGLMQIATCLR